MSSWIKYFLILLSGGVFALADTAPFGVVRARVGNLKDNAYAVAVQFDGKILTAGASFNGVDSDVVLVRYLPDGSVDRMFGEGGATVLDSEKGDDKGYALSLGWDGKIYLAGQVHNGRDSDFALWRFTSNGKLDRGFGMRGAAHLDFGHGNDIAYSVWLQNDGKILVGGVADSGKDRDFALARFLASGMPDPGFGYNGKLMTAFGDKNSRSGDDTAYALLLQPDGKIVLTGYSEVGSTSVMAIVRYLSDGRLDQSFGEQGFTTPYFGRQDRAYTALLDSQGRILIGGLSSDGRRADFAVVRLKPSGSIDRYFGTGGIATVSMSGNLDTVYGLGITEQGEIIAAGSSATLSQGMNLAITRLTAGGSLDTSFGNQGRVLLPGEGKFGAAYGVAVQSDGKILAAGVSSHGDGFQIALARYERTGVLDNTFGLGTRAMQAARDTEKKAATADMGFGGLIPY